MKNRTIEEVEASLEEGISKLKSPEYKSLATFLEPLIAKGYRIHVSLVDKNGRKKRKSASAENWSPDSGEVRISFELDSEKQIAEPAARAFLRPTSPELAVSPDPVIELVRSLDRNENRPGYNFIALKWFRDVALPEEGLSWVQSDSTRQNVIRQAIERRLVLTSKVQNPKSPQFPVTAIRLNRLLPEVQAILGEPQASGSEFEPAEIRGEPLSATILRDRR